MRGDVYIMSYKTTDALMRHLRDDSGIKISGGKQKRYPLYP